MSHYGNDGLGTSVLIYVAAIVCGLAAFVVPVLLINGPTVVANPAARDAIAQIDSARGNGNRYPVAKLRRETIVDPATTAALSAKLKQQEEPSVRRTATYYRSAGRNRRAQDARAGTRPSYANNGPVGPNTPGVFQKLYRSFMY